MRSSKLVMKKKATKKDGTTPIYIQYSYSRARRTLLNTFKAIEPKFWNSDKQEIRRSHTEAKNLNAYLQSLLLKVRSIVDKCINDQIEPTVGYVKEKYETEVLLNKRVNKSNQIPSQENDLIHALDLYMELSASRVTGGVIKQYKMLKNYLLRFQEDTGQVVAFNTMRYDFYLRFKKYLENDYRKPDGEKGLAVNTIGKQIKNLKAFLGDCMKREIIKNIDLSNFKAITEEVDTIYLNEEEISKIADLNLSGHELLEKCRDLFVIGCETGLRFSDFSRLEAAHIKGEFIRKKTQKTHQQVVIPISKLLRQILTKYDNAPPTHLTNQVFNRCIKKIGDMAGIHDEIIMVRRKGNAKVEEKYYKYELITSHTCRRSFCTNQFHRGMPSLLIRKISGHKTEASFLKYIKVDEEAAARKMLEYWNQDRA